MRPAPVRDRAALVLRVRTGDTQRRGHDGGGCEDLRCGCGSLLARWVEAGVELKCRRCKRTVVLPRGDG
jgi:hypothetical protein